MALATDAHGQNVIGEIGSLIPGWRQGDVQADFLFIAEGFNPRKSIGVGPDRVIHTGEIDIEFSALFFQKMWQQKRQFVNGQRVFGRPGKRIPHGWMGWGMDGPRHKLVPGIGICPARCRHCTREGVEEKQGPRDLPATEIPGGRAPPGVSGQSRSSRGDQRGDGFNGLRADSGFLGCKRKTVLRIELFQHGLKVLKRRLQVRPFFLEIFLPVPPVMHEGTVVLFGLNKVVGYGEQNGRLTSRIGCNPMVGVGGTIGQADVKDDELGPTPLGVHNALGVRIKIMARFQVGADEKDHVGMFVVGAGAVRTHPKMIPGASPRRANIGMRVMAIDTPGGQDALGITILARAANVVHDFVVTAFLERSPKAAGNITECLIPGDLLPFPLATFSRPFQGVENAIRIVDLVECGWALSAVPAP